MKATELKSVISDLANLFRAGTARGPAKDLEVLAERIDTSGNKTADEALDALEQDVTAPAQPPMTPKLYIKAFKEAGLDEATFVMLFQRFKSDRSINKAAAMQVMKGYAGAHVRARTKAEAIEEIERRFAELVYDDKSNRQAAATTPW